MFPFVKSKSSGFYVGILMRKKVIEKNFMIEDLIMTRVLLNDNSNFPQIIFVFVMFTLIPEVEI